MLVMCLKFIRPVAVVLVQVEQGLWKNRSVDANLLRP